MIHLKYRKTMLPVLMLTAFTIITASGISPAVETALPATASEATISEAGKDWLLNPKDPPLPDGFYRKSGKWHYRENGDDARDVFIVSDGALFHTGPDGALNYGWYQDHEDWYYFDGAGKSETGWILDGDAWYYLEGTAYLTGWNRILFQDEMEWFCFSEEGTLYQGCMTPDGYTVDADGVYQETQPEAYDAEGFVWDKERQDGKISGLMVAGQPAELYMLSMAGETSGGGNIEAIRNGDMGRAYGLCQFDYRYDLVGFMNYAYCMHPKLWPGFEPFLNSADADKGLRGNTDIGNAFILAMATDYETAVSDQLSYIVQTYWNPFYNQMNKAGYRLDARNTAVSAAFLSVNVNCGPQPQLYMAYLSPEMTDEELIRGVYELRNTILAGQRVGDKKKGTTKRYRQAEPRMALDLLYGYVTIDSEVNYGGGVEWHGNPFVSEITTQARFGHAAYEVLQTHAPEDGEEATPSEPGLDSPLDPTKHTRVPTPSIGDGMNRQK